MAVKTKAARQRGSKAARKRPSNAARQAMRETVDGRTDFDSYAVREQFPGDMTMVAEHVGIPKTALTTAAMEMEVLTEKIREASPRCGAPLPFEIVDSLSVLHSVDSSFAPKRGKEENWHYELSCEELQVADEALRQGFTLAFPCRKQYAAFNVAQLAQELGRYVRAWYSTLHEMIYFKDSEPEAGGEPTAPEERKWRRVLKTINPEANPDD